MSLLSLVNLSFTYASPTLLDNVTLHIERGERIGLVGRNGAGKSTLMKIIAGRLQPDDGIIEIQPDAVIAQLVQEVPSSDGKSAFEVAAEGFGKHGTAVAGYRRLNNKMQHGEVLSAAEEKQYEQCSTAVADADLLSAGDQLETLMAEMSLPFDVPFDSLSAGMKRRVLLARAMICKPDILLLDEPTNHLDIESIIWLQDYLSRFSGTLIFVTHDRVFLQELASRIIEVDRGRLFDWTCDYNTFLVRRDQLLAAEAVEQAHFDKKLAEEERWIRQGIKARRTRNEGRVRALKKMREERKARREKVGTAKMQIQEAERSGALVAKLEDVSHSFGDHQVINNFSTTVFRGDRIGIIGPNGAGKSTLLRILLGQLQPTSGKVRLGTNLSVAYFDQLRDQLDDNKSARENIGDGTDFLLINGNKRHVVGYLQDFLFSPDRAQTLARFLSGGERNRLLLARMMSKPANIMVLDEPTNDLDAETLELLEEMLPEFSGTILLVSHDRAFLNNVVTSTFVFESDGQLREYDGGYDDWLRQRKATAPTAGHFSTGNTVRPRSAGSDDPSQIKSSSAAADAAKSSPVSATGSSTASSATAKTGATAQTGETAKTSATAKTGAVPAKARKLSFREQRELDELPDRIAALEDEQKQLAAQLADPAFYQAAGHKAAEIGTRLQQVEEELLHCLERWEILEQ